MVWVADRGFASAANRAYLTRGGGHYIHVEKLRHTLAVAGAALARPGRYRPVAGNLRVKEVHVAPGGAGDGDDDGARTNGSWCVTTPSNERDATVRANVVAPPTPGLARTSRSRPAPGLSPASSRLALRAKESKLVLAVNRTDLLQDAKAFRGLPIDRAPGKDLITAADVTAVGG